MNTLAIEYLVGINDISLSLDTKPCTYRLESATDMTSLSTKPLSRGMAINMLVQKLCREEEVGFVDLWGSFVGRADMYMKDGLHLSGKGAAVFADKLSAAVDSDLGTMTNIFGSKHSLN